MRRKAVVPFGCGVAPMAFTGFVANPPRLVAVGAALAAIPYFVRI